MSDKSSSTVPIIEGQLSSAERELLVEALRAGPRKPQAVLEVGTWLGGGSTLHILRALQENEEGHLWGIEADKTIYDRMMANLRRALPDDALHRFTPLFGRSQDVIPDWLAKQGPDFQVDLAFLDGGNNPGEQVAEFELLDSRMPVGAVLLAHDARTRKGKWLVPYLTALDHWDSRVLETSDVGLLSARKVRPRPSPASLAAARRLLRRMRLQPAEIAAAYLPSAVCGFILRLLPRRLSRRLSDG